MAVPVYATDLTDIDLAESTTGWTALGGGASGLSASPDLSMQGTNCVDKQVTAANKGQVFDNGNAISLGGSDHLFIWLYVATPGLTDSLQNEGVVAVAGSSDANYVAFHVEGNDTYGAGGRVGRCYPIRYQNTANAAPPYRTLYGTPGASPQVFGGKIKTTASVKGANLGVDAIRYGTGIYMTAGDPATPATFQGAAAQDNAVANRWGVLTLLSGAYELQGRFVVGQDNGGTPIAAYFDASNALLSLVDTVHSQADFTQIIVDHASTVFNLTNVTIKALGTNNPGRLVFNNANTVSELTNCTFDGIGISVLRAGVSANGCKWRSTDQITTNGAALGSCTISGSGAASAVVTDDLNDLSDCEFISAGTGHAVELTALGSGTMNWNCTLSGYAGSDGSTGNEALFVNVAAGSLTINVGAGYSTPSIRTAGATVNMMSGQVTTTITVKDLNGVVIPGARVYLIADVGGPLSEGSVIFNALTDVNGQVSDTRSLASDQPVFGWVRKASAAPYYKDSPISATISNASGLDLNVLMIGDE